MTDSSRAPGTTAPITLTGISHTSGPSSLSASTATPLTSTTRPRNARVPVPVYTETPRSGLRKLNLPTVGATQAAADAAAAAMNSPPSFSRGDRSVSSLTEPEPADTERTRYFRRLSALPPALPHVPTMPKPVLKFVDATRGVLFSLSQIYAAIAQYTAVCTDERLVAHFQRVLGIANKAMNVLIGALDRLDASSRTAVPESSMVRHVLEACNEALRAFRRAATMLHMQLPQLGQSVDLRFSRTLVLLLYGSVAELRNSAQLMAPQVAEVVPFLMQDSSTQTSAADTSIPALSSSRYANRPSHTESSFATDAHDLLASDTSHSATSTPLKKRTARMWTTQSMRSPRLSPRQSRRSDASPHVPLSPSSTSTPSRMRALTTRRDSMDDALLTLLSQVTDSAMHIWTDLRDYVQAGLRRDQEADSDHDTRTRRLRDVDESCVSILDLTKRLQMMRDRVSDTSARSHASDVQELRDQSNQFVRVRMNRWCRSLVSLSDTPGLTRRPSSIYPRSFVLSLWPTHFHAISCTA